ncbi:MAG: alpha/beta fold hydrolase [Myxococcales bacterium]
MHHFIRDQATLAYEDTGAGPPLLLLHAFPLSSAMWQAQRASLSARFRVLAPDLRGFGGSSVQPEVSMRLFAEDAVALLDHVGVLKASVVGLSMGGYAALELLALAPHRVSALALCDTRANADDEAGRRAREETARAVERDGVEVLVQRMLPKLLAPDAAEGVEAKVASMIRAVQPAGAAAALRAMGARRDMSEALGRIGCPTLVLAGEHDGITPPEVAEKMASAIPYSTLEIVPGAGHLANLEAPEAFDAALIGFLDEAL